MITAKPRETFELLDGLRGICAICVVAMHIADQYGLIYSIPHAYIAVPFFFMLSGIVISHAYEKGIMKNSNILYFMTVRIERLYPLLVMGIVISLSLNSITHKWNYDGKITLMILASIFLIPWPGQSLFPLLPPQWSLAIELWGNLAHRLIVKRLHELELVLIIASGGIAMSYYAVRFGGLNIGWSLQNGIGGIAIFAFCYPCGILLYRLRDRGRLWQINASLSLLIFALLATIVTPTPLRTFANGMRDLICVILIFPFILICSINLKATGIKKNISKWLGKISYPIYITHYPLVIFLTSIIIKLHLSKLFQYITVPVFLLMSILLSCLCLFLDVTIRVRLKSIRGNRAVAQPAAAP
ncbi:acyltransferase family protein [Novosphingobium terrae]|uniref:acyltransferase family protein n=1 Tax=Novosphingobium terrae TaxID=2726189 RepID=UPI0019823373|nr:acyltransferase [Novosphingobium terrae]